MLLITSVVFIAGALVCAAAGSIQILILGRVVVGMRIGLASSVVPLYISEISPAKARGWQVSLFQLAITVGILAAYVADYAFSPSAAWRWMLGLAVIPGALLGAGMLCFVRHQSGTDLLVAHCRDLSAEDSRSGSRNRGRDKLAGQLCGFAHFPVAAETARTELDLLALWRAGDWFLALLVLPCPGNERTFPGGDRIRLA